MNAALTNFLENARLTKKDSSLSTTPRDSEEEKEAPFRADAQLSDSTKERILATQLEIKRLELRRYELKTKARVLQKLIADVATAFK